MSKDEPSCPYGDKDCPKVVALRERIVPIEVSLNILLKLVYVMAGIMMIQFGVTLI